MLYDEAGRERLSERDGGIMSDRARRLGSLNGQMRTTRHPYWTQAAGKSMTYSPDDRELLRKVGSVALRSAVSNGAFKDCKNF